MLDHNFHDTYIPTQIEKFGVQLRRDGRVVYTNVPHYVVEHSPDGFEWGYGGSGPSDLALNILEWFFLWIGYDGERQNCYLSSCFRISRQLNQAFKWEFVAKVPQSGGVIPYADIENWVLEHMRELR